MVVWGLVMGLPVGGGSEAYVRSACAAEGTCDPAAAVADERTASANDGSSEAPALASTYPRFLRPLPADRGRARNHAGAAASRRPVREVLLSFDDGPDLYGTPLVLDALDRHGRKGIFFVNGRYLLGTHAIDLERRDLVRRLAAHGHLVANHTLTHRNLCRQPSAAAEEIDTNSEIIGYATGLRPLLFRSPYGARCRSLDETLRERDLVQVGWNIDPQEWKCDDQEAVFRYVTGRLGRLSGRAILLLHDTQPAAVRALPRILDWIDEENARVARDSGTPLHIVDYGVFVPERAIPPTGLEPLLNGLASALAALPGPPAFAHR